MIGTTDPDNSLYKHNTFKINFLVGLVYVTQILYIYMWCLNCFNIIISGGKLLQSKLNNIITPIIINKPGHRLQV